MISENVVDNGLYYDSPFTPRCSRDKAHHTHGDGNCEEEGADVSHGDFGRGGILVEVLRV